jgi:hypothetical protein
MKIRSDIKPSLKAATALPSNEVSGVFNENYQNEIAVPKDSNGQNVLQQPE